MPRTYNRPIRGVRFIADATDGAELYGSEFDKIAARDFPNGFDEKAAATTAGRHLGSITDDHLLECTTVDRNRIFNLGYYTWVEQQGVEQSVFDERREPAFWEGVRDLVEPWDGLIKEFNSRTGLA